MDTLIAVIIVILILFFAFLYIYRAKKSGQKCIGCPYSKECSKNRCSCDK